MLETLGNIALPTVSWAMSGPSQPEFSAYQSAGGTDMVNLSTGDMSYSIPVLDVPGPERSVSLPLSYQAGIQLEQEASWVGLGWSLNPGAINRTVNGYADDAMGEPVQTSFYKKIADGDEHWVIWGIWRDKNNSIDGRGGSVDLLGIASINWGKDGIGGDIIGIGYQPGQGIGVNPVRMALAVASIASAGSAVATAEATSAFSVAAGGSFGGQVAAKVGISGIISNAIGAGVGIGISSLGLGRQGGVAGFNNEPTQQEYSDWAEQWWRVFYNNRTTENAYGSLYFGKMSQQVLSGTDPAPGSRAPEFGCSRDCASSGYFSYETAADIHQFGDMKYGDYYASSLRPVSIAHDNFQVQGEGVSGGMRPYRLDVGSVAYPKLGRSECTKHKKYMVVPFQDNYKVGFRYENDLSNTYNYHKNDPNNGNSGTGLEMNAASNAVIISDPRLSNPTERIEPTRKGLTEVSAAVRKLVHGKHVVWYSNAEIQAMATLPFQGYTNGFVNFEQPIATNKFAKLIKDTFRYGLPPNGIGAFAVTAEDGTTYHYSLPMYEYKTYSEGNEVRVTMGEAGKSIKIEGMPSDNNPHGGYATTWLLTAVTSSDYIDRNNSGTVDEGDWGGWVKYSYGKFSSHYKWRQPYIGTSYSDEVTPIDYEGFTEGYKETYYLNSISTRTHTALFVKSIREDARGHFSNTWTQPNNYNQVSHLGIDERMPASSLRLDEIVLLDNATLKRLQTVNGISVPNDANTIPALSNNTNNNATANSCNCGDDMTQVLDAQDINADVRIKEYLEANAIKRVRFNYTYELCVGTPNSFQYQPTFGWSLPPMTEAQASEGRGGKLTLKSLSFFGPAINRVPTKIIPDFKFGYDNEAYTVAETNPAYGKEKWDGFGMYNPAGAHNTTSHKPSASGYGAPWSLTRITSPLGGVVEIAYERDTYAHVSEFSTVKFEFSNRDCSTLLTVSAASMAGLAGDLTHYLKKGDKIKVTGAAYYTSYCEELVEYPSGPQIENVPRPCNDEYKDREVTIQEVTGNTIELIPEDAPVPGEKPNATCSDIEASGVGVSALVAVNRPGGDIRVASVTTRDENKNAYQVRYKYTREGDLLPGVNSSGVLAKEPSFLQKTEYPFEQNFDYPSTPVIYGRVTVLRGQFRNNDESDIEQREVYAFFTPSSTMLTTQLREGYGTLPKGSRELKGKSVEFYDNNVKIKTGLIGRPKSVAVYNKAGHQELSTDFGYANEVANTEGVAKQGHYTEGVLTNELLDLHFYRINRTTKEYVPSVMVSSRSTRNGISIENNNVLYDFYTGQVLETSSKNALGTTIHSRTVPAYTIAAYASMGPKGNDAANSHMLMQQAASYVYSEVAGGPAYNPLNPFDPRTTHMLSAQVKTWKNTWSNYPGTDANGAPMDEAGPHQPMWREESSYAWQAPVLNPDGSYRDFVAFNWAGTPDSRWLKGFQTLRYDHFSHPLEGQDMNGLYATTKMGYNQSQAIASASNAKYQELAYSGAEDLVTGSNPAYFGGGVAVGGTQVNTVAHSGTFSNQLNSNQSGFVYRAHVGTDLTAGKTYRVSVWVHKNNAQAAQLYASANGTVAAQATVASAQTKKAGDWYRLVLTGTVVAGQQMEFGCKNTGGGSVYFDDFRFCPLTSTMTSQVFDPRPNKVTYTLDNENLYTRYQYDPAGKLYRVYKETFDRADDVATGAKLVKEYAYNYARNGQYPISVNFATNPAGGSASPSNMSQVVAGEDTKFSFTATNCTYTLNSSFIVDGDGISRTGSYTLPDGTKLTLAGTQLMATNVMGAHTVTLSYQQNTFPPAGTVISNCLEYEVGCLSGQAEEYIADGCGGKTNVKIITNHALCQPKPGCEPYRPARAARKAAAKAEKKTQLTAPLSRAVEAAQK
ncbi:hypothetical protein [Hymenobacter chitinivorans]|uniref:hypothetical protein n=1 Tax=Hymenobacter chitinivorans TaxID=89969 RepID=UPI000C249883|nr:hypothetical protein [Hymenobacter chitinivorans]